ncbi:MAG TPA: DUF983 domain-containing protein [Methylomirabilota bacterium]|nr:DUF983 domain-containing protein [Methylomirabilota bacterium]
MAAESAARRLSRGLRRALALRCPRCGRAPLFRSRFAMFAECAACGLTFERAQGYWVGAIYVNYAVTVGITMAGFLLLWRVADLSTGVQLALWLPFVTLFPLWFFRYSRALWLAVEHAVNPEP